ININITLLFAVERYLEVAETYLGVLEARVAEGKPVDRLSSVASFFVSRVDTKVDQALDRMEDVRREHGVQRGRAGISNANLAFREWQRLYSGERWNRLAQRGARPQRLLWASTSPKDPLYPDLYYAEALIGPSTVDTMTRQTFDAYLGHGRPEVRLPLGLD